MLGPSTPAPWRRDWGQRCSRAAQAAPPWRGAQDEDRLKRAVNAVPTHAERNAALARSEQERLIFDHLDASLPWPEPASARPLRPVGHERPLYCPTPR